MALTAPELTPQQIAARKAAEVAVAHGEVVAKTGTALQVAADYTRAEYGKTYARVGAVTFARLNELEPGAAYAAAESNDCNRVSVAMVSDVSKPGAAVWFVDCANENRFMISQQDAEADLGRFKAGKLAARKLERTCTVDTVAMCKATPAQRAAKDKEIEY